jgi:hypothetical protein
MSTSTQRALITASLGLLFAACAPAGDPADGEAQGAVAQGAPTYSYQGTMYARTNCESPILAGGITYYLQDSQGHRERYITGDDGSYLVTGKLDEYLRIIIPGFEPSQMHHHNIDAETCGGDSLQANDYCATALRDIYLIDQDRALMEETCPEKLYIGPPCG